MAEARILTVCTANICRSPATAALLRRGLPELYPARVDSAGSAAIDGSPACDVSCELIGDFIKTYYPAMPLTAAESTGHRSHRFQRPELEGADLILALDRSHRAAVAQMAPRCRSKTFTLRQAATAASVVTTALNQGVLPEGAPPLPDALEDRFTWWVGELDALRSVITGEHIKAGNLAIDPLDVPDPHVEGYQYHPVAAELIERSVGVLLRSLATLTRFGV